MSGLPGAIRRLGDSIGRFCETEGHEKRPATHTMQGETDSFGAEYIDLCSECAEKFRGTCWYEGDCEHCGQEAELWGWRDPDEGLNGPVYALCQRCRQRANAVRSLSN
jgi:RecJ-like exonuclease